MDADGTKDGFDIPLTRAVSRKLVGIPVIASGGRGQGGAFLRCITEGKADAGLAATIFHYKEMTIAEVKQDLRAKGVEVR